MTYWKRLNRKSIYSSSWLEMTVDDIELPDGKVIQNFELMHFPHEAVGMIALNSSGEIALVRAYRYLHESFDWEIPGGVVEPGEKPVDAVKRELLEETGFSSGMITRMLSYFPHKATCDQRYHIYLVENIEEKTKDFMKVEITEVKFFSVDEILKMINSGEINDGMSIVGLQRYLLRRLLNSPK